MGGKEDAALLPMNLRSIKDKGKADDCNIEIVCRFKSSWTWKGVSVG